VVQITVEFHDELILDQKIDTIWPNLFLGLHNNISIPHGIPD
jgi:hypothetical protein